MAVAILKGKVPHNARHDLESFFYVLLWLCMYHSGPGNLRRPESDIDNMYSFFAILQRQENMFDAAGQKKGLVTKDTFKSEVIPSLDPTMVLWLGDVLNQWRDILFPLDIETEAICFGIPTGKTESMLYKEMIDVMDGAIIKVQEAEAGLQTNTGSSAP